MADPFGIPEFRRLMYPTLRALKQLGGSARIEEISDAVTAALGFTEEQQAVRRKPDHNMSLIDYRLAWARNYLKNIGAISNSARGVWAITDLGENLSEDDVLERVRSWKAEYNKAHAAARKDIASTDGDSEIDTSIAEDSDGDELEGTDSWQDQVLDVLMNVKPDAFERLAQRLLREAGFRNVEVLGKSGDGGIDGVGVYRLSLVSFPVFFQCKRYRGSVGPGHVRDFRGAMSGRGEKGLLITTGSFTRDAKAEATRDGAPPVELIDGQRLCDLLQEYDLGVTTRTRTVEDVLIEPEFFDRI
jgi:restriction system protein